MNKILNLKLITNRKNNFEPVKQRNNTKILKKVQFEI